MFPACRIRRGPTPLAGEISRPLVRSEPTIARISTHGRSSCAQNHKRQDRKRPWREHRKRLVPLAGRGCVRQHGNCCWVGGHRLSAPAGAGCRRSASAGPQPASIASIASMIAMSRSTLACRMFSAATARASSRRLCSAVRCGYAISADGGGRAARCGRGESGSGVGIGMHSAERTGLRPGPAVGVIRFGPRLPAPPGPGRRSPPRRPGPWGKRPAWPHRAAPRRCAYSPAAESRYRRRKAAVVGAPPRPAPASRMQPGDGGPGRRGPRSG